jgi:hypothetical protein
VDAYASDDMFEPSSDVDAAASSDPRGPVLDVSLGRLATEPGRRKCRLIVLVEDPKPD